MKTIFCFLILISVLKTPIIRSIFISKEIKSHVLEVEEILGHKTKIPILVMDKAFYDYPKAIKKVFSYFGKDLPSSNGRIVIGAYHRLFFDIPFMIVIQRDFVENSSDLDIKAVISHEMTHYIYNKKHSPKGLMHRSTDVTTACVRSYGIKDCFNQSFLH